MPCLNDPALKRWAETHQFRLYAWRIEEDETMLTRLLPPHFDYATEALRRFGSPKRRCEWLAARVLLHQEAGITERLSYDDNGQPRLSSSRQFISISHSRAFVFLQLSTRPVGIDVETHSPRAYRLRERFLTTDELPLLCDKTATAEQRATLLWCAKEAAFKRFPNTEATTLMHIHLCATPRADALLAHFATPPVVSQLSAKVHLALFQEYALAVCE